MASPDSNLDTSMTVVYAKQIESSIKIGKGYRMKTLITKVSKIIYLQTGVQGIGDILETYVRLFELRHMQSHVYTARILQ